MANFGKFDFSHLQALQTRLSKLQDVNDFIDRCAKDIAAELLKKVIERTPVGDYTKEVQKTAKRTSKNHKKGDTWTERVPDGSGRNGGTLRRNWKIGNINRSGNFVLIEVYNPTQYASYVEYGHRQEPGRYVPALGKKLVKSWVPGKFMLTISAAEIRADSSRDIENKIKNYLTQLLQDVFL